MLVTIDMKLSIYPGTKRYLVTIFLSLTLALLAAIILGSGEAKAKTIYVDDDAGEGGDGSIERPFSRIQDGVNASENGDTVRVFEGVYEENVLVDRRIDLIGNGSETTSIPGANNSETAVRLTAAGAIIQGFSLSPRNGFWWVGISFPALLVEADNCRISDMEINASTCLQGISLHEVQNITISNTSITKGGVVIEGDDKSYWTTHSIDDSNLVNNRTLHYLFAKNGGTLPAGAGQVILVKCSNITVREQNCSRASRGILLGFSENITIEKNTYTSFYSIYLYRSHHNQILENDLSDGFLHPFGYGIYLNRSDLNFLSDNDCSRNGRGISLKDSHNNTILDSIFHDGYQYGIVLSGSHGNTLKNNRGSSEIHYSIYLWESNQNILDQNTCSSNRGTVGSGIYLAFSHENTLNQNNCSYNARSGIKLQESHRNLLESNSCWRNEENGIQLWSKTGRSQGCDNTSILNNTFGDNQEYGIYLSKSNRTRIQGNLLFGNSEGGLKLQGSSYSNITENNISRNERGIVVARFTELWEDNNSAYFPPLANEAHYNNITGNLGTGIAGSMVEGNTINASHNWWGHDSGPYHYKMNPGGKGDSFNYEVIISPWLNKNGSVNNSWSSRQEPSDDGNDLELPQAAVLLFVLAFSLALFLILTFPEPLRYTFLALYTRLNPERIESDIAQQNTRGQIYSFIKEQPGINLSSIKEETNLGYGTVVYHLSVLQREGYLRTATAGRKKQFWTKRDFPGLEETSLTDTQRAILEALKEKGKMTRKELQEQTGIPRSTLGTNIRELVKDGKMEEEEEGEGGSLCSLKLY